MSSMVSSGDAALSILMKTKNAFRLHLILTCILDLDTLNEEQNSTDAHSNTHCTEELRQE